MDNKGGGKIPRKRTRLSAKPYSRAITSSTRETGSSSGHRSGADTNQSLLKRVSSSLLGFVTPSWLTSYWSSSSQKNEISEPARDTETPPLTEPRYSDDEEEQPKNEPDAKMEGIAVTQNVECSTKGTPFSFQQPPLGASTPVDDFSNKCKAPIQVCNDDASDVSMATSSVSMIPQVDNTDYQNKMAASNLSKLDERSSSKPWTRTDTPLPARPNSRPQPSGKNLQRPSFNSSYFGSPITGQESPVGPFASPFYPGRTMYGGASAQRSSSKSSRPVNSPYQVYHPIKRRVKPKQASSMNSSFGVTSAAAKQILETLEKMSTPLSDAKKIPLSPTASPLVFNPTKRARTSLRPGPPVAPRSVPTHAAIATTRQTLLSSTEEPERPRKQSINRRQVEEITETPSTAKFSVQSTFKFGVPNSIPGTPASTSVVEPLNPGSGGGGKMKSKKKSAVHVSNKEDEEKEMLEEVDLPNIALPLAKGKMPSFNFAAPSSKSSFKSSMSQNSQQVTSTSPSNVTKPNLQFQFSSPIFKEGLPAASHEGLAKTFTFSSPKPAAEVVASKPATTEPSTSKSAMQFSFSSPSTSAPKPKETTIVEPVSFEGGLKPAKELKKGSCLEFLGIVPSKPSSDDSGNNKKPIIGFGDKFKTEPGTWNCSVCLLDNKPGAMTCIACMAAKPNTSNNSNKLGLKQDSVDSSQSINLSESGTMASNKTCSTHLQSSNVNRTSPPQFGFGDKFKPEAGTWNCNVCLLDNKPERKTCIACSGPRPQETNSSGSQISLAEKFKPKEGVWTCETCLVDNKKESLKCVACMMPKPSASSQASSIEKEQSDRSSISLQQKLAPPAGSWTCDTCLIQNKSTDTKCLACSTAKPASKSESSMSLLDKFAPPPGSWSCDTCFIQNKSSDAKCVACGSTKPGEKLETKSVFGFGDKFKAPAGSWICDTCLIQNNKSTSKCLACGASQPGSEPALKAPPASAFKFGGSLTKSSSDTTSSSTFKFGGTAPPSTGGFSFGGKSEQSKPVVGGFKFGIQSPVTNTNTFSAISETESSKTTDTVSQDTKSITTPVFQFGKACSSLEKTEPTGGFTFGKKSEVTPMGTFGQSTTMNSIEKPTKSISNTGETAGITGGFKFGNATSTTANTENSSSSTFVFGAKTNNTNNLAKSDSEFLSGKPSEKSVAKEASSSSFQFPTGSGSTGFSFGSKNTSAVDNKESSSVFGSSNKLSGNVTVNNNDLTKPTTGVAFQFGASTETKNPAPFTFSGQPKEEPVTKPSTTFSFGKSLGQDEVPKPNTTFSFGKSLAQDEGPPAKMGGFSFGSDKVQETASTTNTSSLPAFTFGAKPAAAPPVSTTVEQPTFKFGQNTNPTPPTFGGFGAAVNNSTTPVLGNNVNSTTGGFNFNSSTTNNGGGFNFNSTAPKFGATSSVPAFGATTSPVAPVPTFGGQNNSTIGSSGFGMGNSNSVGFGGAGANNTPAPAFGSTAPQTNGPGFQFNSGSSTKSSNSFQFGQQNNSTPVFQFGAKNAELSSTTPATTGGFNFGSAPVAQANNFSGFGATPTNDSNAFQFKSAGATNDNPFNAVSSGSSVQGRKIKKAQRRIKKQ